MTSAPDVTPTAPFHHPCPFPSLACPAISHSHSHSQHPTSHTSPSPHLLSLSSEAQARRNELTTVTRSISHPLTRRTTRLSPVNTAQYRCNGCYVQHPGPSGRIARRTSLVHFLCLVERNSLLGKRDGTAKQSRKDEASNSNLPVSTHNFHLSFFLLLLFLLEKKDGEGLH